MKAHRYDFRDCPVNIMFIHNPLKVEFRSNKIRSSKYTLLTFWILNPFEQFRRMANFTYLMMAVVQLLLPEPPVSPMTTIYPLAFVVIVSMIKQVDNF